MAQKHWLMKSEPTDFSIQDLKKEKRALWTGVRNYQARNFMTKEMEVGDRVIFYHSNATPPCAAGLARVSGKAVADPTAFDPKSDYFDPKATKENPIWFCVEVAFEKAFKRPVALDEMRKAKKLQTMVLLQKGSRLSVQPVTSQEFAAVLEMAEN